MNTTTTTNTNALATVDAEIAALEPDSAASLRATFDKMFAQTEEWAARARS